MPDPSAAPFEIDGQGVQLRLRVTPKGRRSRIDGFARVTADGAMVLKVTVAAAPEDGKANAAVVAMLAKAWRLPKSALTIRAGLRDRHKTVRINTGAPADAVALAARLTAWAGDLSPTASDTEARP